jgi:hypothetical protein
MKGLIFFITIFNFNSYSWGISRIDLDTICLEKVPTDHDVLVVFDGGFCDQYLKLEAENILEENISYINLLSQPLNIDCDSPLIKTHKKQDDKWKIRLYASHSYTTYFNSDISLKSSRYNIEIKDYEWAERSSREFFTYDEWKKPGSNPLQMIDEPTNTFTISIEKNGHEFFLSAFHPKFLQADNQVKYVKGTIDGTEVDGVVPINKPFDDWDQVPGESELVRNANTHKQMTFELGYGYRFKLFDSKLGSMSYIPSLGIGVMAGENRSTVIKPNEWFEFDDYKDNQYIQGVGGSVTNRIEFNSRKEKVGFFYENKLGYYQQNHGFLDGKQSYNIGFMGNSVGVKVMIYNSNKKKNQKTPK